MVITVEERNVEEIVCTADVRIEEDPELVWAVLTDEDEVLDATLAVPEVPKGVPGLSW